VNIVIDSSSRRKSAYLGKYVIIENVLAGVCTECGTRYYAASVLRTSEEIIGE
jgi:YgiT-type zinc finger domain-containing protein